MKKKKTARVAEPVVGGNGNGRGSANDLCAQLDDYIQERNTLKWKIKCGNNGDKNRSNRLKRLQTLEKVVIPRLEAELRREHFKIGT